MQHHGAVDLAGKKRIDAVGKETGYLSFTADAIIWRWAVGSAPQGRFRWEQPSERDFFCGTAQRYINVEGYMVGKKAVILGSATSG